MGELLLHPTHSKEEYCLGHRLLELGEVGLVPFQVLIDLIDDPSEIALRLFQFLYSLLREFF